MKYKIVAPMWSQRKRDFMGEVFKLVVKRLGIEQHDKIVCVSIEDPKDMYRENKNVSGYIAPWVGDFDRRTPDMKRFNSELFGGGKTKQPKRFKIVLENQDIIILVVALCHELVHLKQWVNGEQQLGEWGSPRLWMGIPVPNKAINYKDQPWEKEAHERMYQLAEWVLTEIAKSDGQWADDVLNWVEERGR